MAVTPHRKSAYDEGSLDQYLRDISIYPLIDRAEEVRLAQLIRRKDMEALDKLVRSNLRFGMPGLLVLQGDFPDRKATLVTDFQQFIRAGKNVWRWPGIFLRGAFAFAQYESATN